MYVVSGPCEHAVGRIVGRASTTTSRCPPSVVVTLGLAARLYLRAGLLLAGHGHIYTQTTPPC